MDIDISNKDSLIKSTNKLEAQFNNCYIKAHSHQINDILITQKEPRQIITCSFDQTIKIWDYKNRNLIKQLTGHGNSVMQILLNKDETQLFSLDMNKVIKIWDLNIYECKREINYNLASHFIKQIRLDRNDSQIYILFVDRSFRVFNLQANKEVLRIQFNLNDPVSTFIVNNEDNIFYFGNKYGKIMKKDISQKEQQQIQFQKGHNMEISCMDLNKNQDILITCSFDKTIIIWNTINGNLIRKLKGHTDSIINIKFDLTQNFIFSCSKDQTLRIWHYKTGTEIIDKRMEGHSDLVKNFVFAEDKTVVSCSFDRSIRIWYFEDFQELINQRIICHKQSVYHMELSKNGQFMYTCCSDKILRKIDLQKNEIVKEYKGSNFILRYCVLDELENKIYCCGEDNLIKVFNESTGEQLISENLKGHSLNIQKLVIDYNKNKLYSASFDMTIKVWDLNTHTNIDNLIGHQNWVLDIIINQNGSKLFSSSADNQIRIWDVSQQQAMLITILEGHENTIRCIRLNQQENLLYSCSSDCTIRVWDLKNNSEIISKRITCFKQAVRNICLSKDNKVLICCSNDKTVRFFDIEKQIQYKQLTIQYSRDYVLQVLLDRNENILYTSNRDGRINLWDIKNYNHIQQSLLFILKKIFNGTGKQMQNINKLIYHLKLRDYYYLNTKLFLLLCCVGNEEMIKKYIYEFGIHNIFFDNLYILIHSILNMGESEINWKQLQRQFSKRIYTDNFDDSSNLETNNQQLDYQETFHDQQINPLNAKIKYLDSINNIQNNFVNIESNRQLQQNLIKSLRGVFIAMDQKADLQFQISLQTVKSIFDLHKFNRLFGRTLFNYYKKLVGQRHVELKNDDENIIIYDPKDYEQQSQYKKLIKQTDSYDYKNYNYYVTTVPIDISKGSYYSIKFFELLQKSNDELREYMLPIINIKWMKILKFLFIHFILYFLLMIFADFGILKFGNYKLLLGLAFPIVVLLLIIEFMTLRIAQHKYFTLYNIFDIIILSFTLVMLILNFFMKIEQKMNVSNFIVLLFINLRFILELRLIRMLRYLIAMFIKVIYDIISFVVLTLCFVYLYAVLTYSADMIYGRDLVGFGIKLHDAMNIIIGNADTDLETWEFLDWAIFIAFIIVLLIIMFNLIIAIISDTFAIYQQDKEKIDCLQRIEMILDFDRFSNNFRRTKFKKEHFHYYQILEEKKEDKQQENIEKEIKDLKISQEKIQKQLDSGDKIFQQMFEELNQIKSFAKKTVIKTQIKFLLYILFQFFKIIYNQFKIN